MSFGPIGPTRRSRLTGPPLAASKHFSPRLKDLAGRVNGSQGLQDVESCDVISILVTLGDMVTVDSSKDDAALQCGY